MHDFRSKAFLVRLFGADKGAHHETCMSVDGDDKSHYVVSGGKDFELKLWDMRQER